MCEFEEEPELVAMLEHLAQECRDHPEILGDMGELLAGTDELLEGVTVD